LIKSAWRNRNYKFMNFIDLDKQQLSIHHSKVYCSNNIQKYISYLIWMGLGDGYLKKKLLSSFIFPLSLNLILYWFFPFILFVDCNRHQVYGLKNSDTYTHTHTKNSFERRKNHRQSLGMKHQITNQRIKHQNAWRSTTTE
jgi:hypothetical protein